MDLIGCIFAGYVFIWAIYAFIKDVINDRAIDKGVRFDNYNYHNLDV